MRTAVKWLARIVGAVVLLIVVACAILYFRGSSAVSGPFETEAVTLAVPSDSAAIANGRYLSNILACTECHGADLSGQVMADAPPFLAVASNLTPAGVGGSYTDVDWERAIRQGVGSDGRGLLIMPSESYNNVSDEEVADLIAFLKQAESVENPLPRSEVRALGKLIAGTGAPIMIPDLVGNWGPRPEMPAPGATAEWGEYRMKTVCMVCHGLNLEGGQPPDPASPLAPPLSSVKGWTLEGFRTAMRTGVTPGGKELDDYFMPWRAFRHMTDTELEALYLALQAR